MRRLSLIVFLFSFVLLGLSGSPCSCDGTASWNAIYGGPAVSGAGYDVQPLPDGSYAVVGRRDSCPDLDHCQSWSHFLLLDGAGIPIFSRTYFPTSYINSGPSEFRSVIPDGSVGFVLGGLISIFGHPEMTLSKLGDLGNLLWSYPHEGMTDMSIFDVVQNSNQDLIAVGVKGNKPSDERPDDILFLGVDADGRSNAFASVGLGESEQAYAMVSQPSGYVIAGSSLSPKYGMKALLVETDLAGVVREYSIFPANGQGFFRGAQSVGDSGNFIVVGSVKIVGHPDTDLVIMQFVSVKEIAWFQFFGWDGDEHGHAVVRTPDGGFAVVGSTTSFGNGGQDLLLVKFTSSGQVSWYKTFGEQGIDRGFGIGNTVDCGLILVGEYTPSALVPPEQPLPNLWVMKTDHLGDAPPVPHFVEVR